LEKTVDFYIKINPAQWFYFSFLVFWGIFWVFLPRSKVFKVVFCPEERFLGFFPVRRILLGASRLKL
jgi:hypothetical protein